MSTPSAAEQSGAGCIVVGVDGSASSEEALRWALGQARLTGQPVEAIVSFDIAVDFGIGALSVHDWEGDATSTLKDTVAGVVGSSSADRVSQRVVRGHPVMRHPSTCPV